jgi:hypothetical protein
MQRAPDEPAERRAPLELEERRRHVRWQPDRDPGRNVEAGVERGQASGADRLTFRSAARAAGGEREIEEAPDERGHRVILAVGAYRRIAW